jgi:hypothetical protein
MQLNRIALVVHGFAMIAYKIQRSHHAFYSNTTDMRTHQVWKTLTLLQALLCLLPFSGRGPV